jgi:hypothetical protein
MDIKSRKKFAISLGCVLVASPKGVPIAIGTEGAFTLSLSLPYKIKSVTQFR